MPVPNFSPAAARLSCLHLTLLGLLLSLPGPVQVVVMEYCDLGALRKALKRRAFVPHGKWTFQTTYVSIQGSMLRQPLVETAGSSMVEH